MIEIRDVTKIYDSGTIRFEALSGVSLTIRDGEFTGIIGPSGSGKSTLMNILGCLDRLTEGTYHLDGQDVSKLKDNALARIRNLKIGFVFQSFNLLPRLTVYENVELPLVYAGLPAKERKVRAEEALEKVGLLRWAHHRPNEISGGQKQRVAIARAIVGNPSVIMADEPTGNLDTKSAMDILRIFQALNAEGRTILMVTHELENMQYLKRVVRFKDGRIVEDRVVKKRTILASEPDGGEPFEDELEEGGNRP